MPCTEAYKFFRALHTEGNVRTLPEYDRVSNPEDGPMSKYIYKVEANPRSDSIKNRYFLQAYETKEVERQFPVMCFL